MMSATNFNPQVTPEDKAINWIGTDLQRPECVLASASGDIYTADWRGGVAHITPSGEQHLYLASLEQNPCLSEPLKPNGIALLKDGSFLVTHLGNELGGVFTLTRQGVCTPWLLKVDGINLPPSNYVVQDQNNRTWVTVSTRLKPRALGYRSTCSDGFIAMVDPQGHAQIVADGLGYTNECLIDAAGKYLYVNETFTRKLSRFPIRANGTLGNKEVVHEFGQGTFPDGLALDAEGGIWVVSIISNRVIRIDLDGSAKLWLEDSDSQHLGEVEAAYQTGTLGRPQLDEVHSKVFKNISSLAFGGRDLCKGYLGCLLGNSIAQVSMPIAGHPPIHWNYT